MKCLICVVETETEERTIDHVHEAFTVYKGEALCPIHFNVVRGQQPDYGYVQSYPNLRETESR